ncbi:aminotransferase class V-fold PLP-dependent enzyme [Conexibacter woesei]|uniref:Aminotransferase class V n=1 Tax=Conexibacter woesei (strain DSM 14684 / CCUG 47730 / CIP 108061 / JCM 11494 / NBRC 100937 / ID131577) TaxID=469383 RepID=D3F9D3_CONWI|nr:aminotransferase class V-fold PLP-dependent enzyme [Conexibacter woesei]ADB49100.1 aminotransferase class V [Conexibacter woesei DSM 14684]
MLDVTRARAETPGCAHVTHLNAAGAALLPAPVVEATIGHLRLEAERGGYEAAAANADAVERPYAAIAELIGCRPTEVAIVENATRAWDMAFYGIPFRPGDRVLTTVAEYASNYVAYLQLTRTRGIQVDVVPNDASGQLDVTALAAMIDDRVRLISVTHVPTNSGLVNPAAEIGRIARAAGILYLVDACQSVGQLPVDVEQIGCDFLSATGRKYLRAPRGTGFLYVRESALDRVEPPFVDLHAARWVRRDAYELRPDARRFENWETNYAGKVGLGVAADYLLGWGIESVWETVRELAATLRTRLEQTPGVHVQDEGATRCGIVTFTKDGLDPRLLREELRAEGINVWWADVSSTRLDMEQRGLDVVVRASVHYYNTHEEIEAFGRRLERHPGHV